MSLTPPMNNILANRKAAALKAVALDPELTPDSAELLLYLIDESANYSYLGDAPLFDITSAEKGNLTHLKKLNYLTTRYEHDCHTTFAYFEDKASDLVKGINY